MNFILSEWIMMFKRVILKNINITYSIWIICFVKQDRKSKCNQTHFFY